MQYQLLPDLTDDEYAALKADIAARGVQVPVELDEHGNVLDGHHRVRACEELDIKDWPSIIRPSLSEDEKIEHILALNLDRRHLNMAQRQQLVTHLRQQGWSFRRIADRLQVDPMTAVSDAKVAVENSTPDRVLGKDGKSYPAKRPAIIAHNRRATQRAIESIESLDTDVIPDGISDSRRIERLARTHRPRPEVPPIPEGTFSVVYADPPWEYSNLGLHGAASAHYSTMPTEKICELPIAEVLADNAVLFLWATNPLLVDALGVISAWGFSYKTNFVWVKDRATYGKLGFYNYGQHELLLVGIRGSCLPAEDSKASSVLQVRKREHSRKPDEVCDLIEAMYPGSQRLELFARAERDGWTSWGDEVDKWPKPAQ